MVNVRVIERLTDKKTVERDFNFEEEDDFDGFLGTTMECLLEYVQNHNVIGFTRDTHQDEYGMYQYSSWFEESEDEYVPCFQKITMTVAQ